MDDGDKVSCILCRRSDETKITGPLSTKDDLTAHQNCLIFSSGLFCRSSPQFDDLFGFSVEDVQNEVKRGSKLMCNKCKHKGATAGCEVKRCKKSYHYPCAVQERAKTVEDADQGKYGLYCSNHYQQTQENNGLINGSPSSLTKLQTAKNPSEAGSSKVYCLSCEKTEGNIALESLSQSIMLYCDKHAPASHKRNTSGDSTKAGRSSVYSSDSNSSSGATCSSSKRHLNSTDKQEGTPSKRKSKGWNKILSDDSSGSGENKLDPEMAMFAPIETDLDENANSAPEPQLIRHGKDTQSPTGSASGNQPDDESGDGTKEEDETIIHSDAESESLLPPVPQSLSETRATVSTQTAVNLYPSVVFIKADEEVLQRNNEGSSPEHSPVHSPDQHNAGPSVPQQNSAGPPDQSKPHSVTHSPPRTSSPISADPPQIICVSLLACHSPPTVPPSDPETSIDSSSFWKSCNAAGCTQAIFTGFIKEMNDISSRIQSDQASQDDYDLALTVMAASGNLAELVAKQQEELQRKQMELQKASAAMKEVVSALRGGVHPQLF